MWIGCARILRAQLDPVRIWVWTSVSSRRRTSHFSFQTEHIESASANTDEIIKYIITQKKTKTFNTEEVIVEKTQDRIFRRILETWDVSVQTDHVVVISSWITPHAGNLRERGIKSQCVQLSVLLYLLPEESCFVSGDSSIVLRGSRQLRHRFKTRPQARRPAVMEKQHITHNLLLWIMKCPLFAQVNWCKPFQDLHLKSTVTVMQTYCFAVGSGVGVSPPLSAAGDWAAVWHHVLMQSAEASERDYRGGARDDSVPTESDWVLLMYVRRCRRGTNR